MNKWALGGEALLSDKTRYESIKILNQALMERLGEVSGELKKAKEELEVLSQANERYRQRLGVVELSKIYYPGTDTLKSIPTEEEEKAETEHRRALEEEYAAEKEEIRNLPDPVWPKPTPEEKKAQREKDEAERRRFLEEGYAAEKEAIRNRLMRDPPRSCGP
jgi:hypothetical protein